MTPAAICPWSPRLCLATVIWTTAGPRGNVSLGLAILAGTGGGSALGSMRHREQLWNSAPMKFDRLDRVNESIQRALAELFEEEIAPRVTVLVTVTRVRVAPDLRTGRVSVSVYGDDSQRREVMALIAKRRVLLQSGLGRRVRLKYTPVLDFVPDTSLDDADRVISLLNELAPDDACEQEAEAPPTE